MEKEVQQDEFVDIIEILKNIWQGKWVIILVSFIGLIASLIFVLFRSPSYQIEVPYTVNMYSLDIEAYCKNNIKCLEESSNKLISKRLEGGELLGTSSKIRWIANQSPEKNYYMEAVNKIQKQINEAVLLETNQRINLINVRLPEKLYRTETVARQMLAAIDIVASLEGGQDIIEFDEPIIKNRDLDAWTFVAVTSLLCMIMAAFFIVAIGMIDFTTLKKRIGGTAPNE